jgi:hypothetical protein
MHHPFGTIRGQRHITLTPQIGADHGIKQPDKRDPHIITTGPVKALLQREIGVGGHGFHQGVVPLLVDTVYKLAGSRSAPAKAKNMELDLMNTFDGGQYSLQLFFDLCHNLGLTGLFNPNSTRGITLVCGKTGLCIIQPFGGANTFNINSYIQFGFCRQLI